MQEVGRDVVLVTGAGGFVGRHVVNHLVANDYLIWAVDALDTTAVFADLTSSVRVVQCDLRDEAQIESLVHELRRDQNWKASGILHLAGINPKMAETDATSVLLTSGLQEDIEHFVVGVGSLVAMLESLGKDYLFEYLKSVVIMSSDLGLRGPNQTLYCICGCWPLQARLCSCPKKPAAYSSVKAAQIGLTRHLAATLGPLKVRANAIAPAGIAEALPQHILRGLSTRSPLGAVPMIAEVSRIAEFLLSDKSSPMSGAVIPVDAGISIV